MKRYDDGANPMRLLWRARTHVESRAPIGVFCQPFQLPKIAQPYPATPRFVGVFRCSCSYFRNLVTPSRQRKSACPQCNSGRRRHRRQGVTGQPVGPCLRLPGRSPHFCHVFPPASPQLELGYQQSLRLCCPANLRHSEPCRSARPPVLVFTARAKQACLARDE